MRKIYFFVIILMIIVVWNNIIRVIVVVKDQVDFYEDVLVQDGFECLLVFLFRGRFYLLIFIVLENIVWLWGRVCLEQVKI